MKTLNKKNVMKQTKRFFKKFAYKMASKILELLVLFGIGYALGLHLIRY